MPKNKKKQATVFRKNVLLKELGIVYTGYLAGKLPHGYGKFHDPNKDTYTEGKFVNGKKTGMFITTKTSVYTIMSEYQDDVQMGYIKMTFNAGDVESIEGPGKNFELNETATIIYRSKSVYQGQVKYGLPMGEGTFTRRDGTVYRGIWKSIDKRYAWFEHWTGFKLFMDMFECKSRKLKEIKYLNGTIYRGPINEELLPHGYGKIFYSDGSKYIGGFDNGIKNGYGLYVYNDGNYYSGFWEDDKREGQGLFYHVNGRYVLSFFWNQDFPTEGIASYYY